MTHTPRVYVDGREFVPKLAPAIHKDQTLAQYIKMLREEAELSVQDVADMTGLRTFSIEAWERETSTLRFSEAALLSRVYGVSLDLFGARIMQFVDEAQGDRAAAPPFIGGDGQVKPVLDKAPPAVQEKPAPIDAAGEADVAAVEAIFAEDVDDSDEFFEGDEEPAAAGPEVAESEAPGLVAAKAKKSSVAQLLEDL